MTAFTACFVSLAIVSQLVYVISGLPQRSNEQNANKWITAQETNPQWFQKRDLLSSLADRWEMNGISGVHDMTESKRNQADKIEQLQMLLAMAAAHNKGDQQ